MAAIKDSSRRPAWKTGSGFSCASLGRGGAGVLRRGHLSPLPFVKSPRSGLVSPSPGGLWRLPPAPPETSFSGEGNVSFVI